MSLVRFLLDERVDHAIREGLRRRCAAEVWAVGDPGVPARGTLDPDILIWCEGFRFSLVTDNRGSMPSHLQEHLAAGRHVPGIFILNPRMSIGETIEELQLIWGGSEAEEYANQMRFLPVTS